MSLAGEPLREHRRSCRSCGRPVFFAHTVNGKIQCVLAEPVENGNLRLTVTTHPVSGTEYVLAEVVGSKKAHPRLFGDAEEKRYQDHHADCEFRDRW